MILQALNGAYERLARQTLANGKPRVPPYGFSYEKIGFALRIDEHGRLIDIDTVDSDLDVPKDPTTTRTSGVYSMFLWDKSAYVLGLAPEQKKRTAEEHAAFKLRHLEVIGDTNDVGLRAVSAFLQGWLPDPDKLPRYAGEVVSTNLVFRLEGVGGYIHERTEARRLWLDFLARQHATKGTCLITGDEALIALTHPTIGGVRGAQSSGASIVSFNQPSFVSLAKEQGANAPVSQKAAFQYTTALNELLRKDSPQKVRIGDATTVFWAEAADVAETEAAEQTVSWLLAPPDTAGMDTAETARIGEIMQMVEKGRPLADPQLHLDPQTSFYILGLSPNAARLSVRFFEATTLGRIGAAFHQHWQDLHMEQPKRKGLPPSIAALVLTTAPARVNALGQLKLSFDDASPLLAGALMRSILSEGRYPGALLSNLVMRIRTDRALTPNRVALIKAILVRTMRLEGRLPQEDYLMHSDPNDPNPARRLGRLFAVLERAQQNALGDNINATIKDKYIGAAAATPANVFVGLIKNSHNHTGRLRKGHADADWLKNKPVEVIKGVGYALERDIGLLWASFNDGLPTQLSSEEQGLFFVGYYQERFGGKAGAADPGYGDTAVGTDSADSDTENFSNDSED
jgi:CRISPR-associated protein Csd1